MSGLCDDVMGEKKRLNLSFSLSNPLQKRAWELLTEIPAGRRTEAVCRMVLEHRNQRELIEAVCDAVREELRGAERTEPITDRREPGSVGDDVLGFLLSLQGGDEQ